MRLGPLPSFSISAGLVSNRSVGWKLRSALDLRPHSPSGENWICWWMMSLLCHYQRSRRRWVVFAHEPKLSKFERGSAFARTRKGTTFLLSLMLWRTLQRGRGAIWKAVGNMQKEYRSTLWSRQERLAPRFFLVDSLKRSSWSNAVEAIVASFRSRDCSATLICNLGSTRRW